MQYKLEDYIDKGFWPGPHEEPESFLARVSCQGEPQYEDELKPYLVKAEDRLKGLLGACLPSLKIEFNNKGLHLFEAGALWVIEDNGVKRSLIQIKENFKKGFFLFYTLDEVLAHEMLHAMRVEYEEPIYEEILAYFTSSISWRRYFGPLIVRPYEAILLLLLAGVGSVLDVFFELSYFIFLLPILWGGYLTLRLLFRQRRFRRAFKIVKLLVKDEKNAFSFIARMTDQEIDFFSQKSLKEIRSYIDRIKGSSLRWEALFKEIISS